MAKKTHTLTLQNYRITRGISLIQRMASLPVVERLSKTYSSLVGEHISPRQTFRLLHAQLALSLLLVFGGISVGVATLLTAWTALAFHQCRLKESNKA